MDKRTQGYIDELLKIGFVQVSSGIVIRGKDRIHKRRFEMGVVVIEIIGPYEGPSKPPDGIKIRKGRDDGSR